MRPRVLLIGPDGQLGHAVRRAHEVSGAPFDLVPLPRGALDLAERDRLEALIGDLRFDALVNCAAFTRVDEAEDDAERAFAVNAHAVGAMARACAAQRARLVHVSTDYVFGGDRTRRRPLRECDPVAPVNVYGASKVLGETLARLECDEVVVLRVASLFGEAGTGGRGGNFVETILRAARAGRPLRVVDDQVMSPTSAADVARVAVRMLAQGCAPGLYHVVNAGSATWFELAREILRQTGIEARLAPCATEEWPARALRPRYCVLDDARIAAAFGALPGWQDALARYLRARGHV